MNHKENIDKLIRQHLQEEQTGNNFTGKLMQKIIKGGNMEEFAMRQLAKKYLPEHTPEEFTTKVMQKITADSKSTVYQPVISKKIWMVIFSFLSVFIITVLFFSVKGNQQTSVVGSYFTKIINILSADYPKILTSPLLAMSMFVMSSLFFLDYFIRETLKN